MADLLRIEGASYMGDLRVFFAFLFFSFPPFFAYFWFETKGLETVAIFRHGMIRRISQTGKMASEFE